MHVLLDSVVKRTYNRGKTPSAFYLLFSLSEFNLLNTFPDLRCDTNGFMILKKKRSALICVFAGMIFLNKYRCLGFNLSELLLLCNVVNKYECSLFSFLLISNMIVKWSLGHDANPLPKFTFSDLLIYFKTE